MIPLTFADLARLTGGIPAGPVADPGLLIDGPVVTDSREAAPGSLYVARIGEHADGHLFAAAAAAEGAVAVLGTRPVEALPTVVVPDVQQAFAALARGVVDLAPDLTIVGITGSSGKTSTKDMLGQVLAAHGPTVAPVGSLNSEVGVPLTVCRIDAATRFLVAEMGASGRGHIAYLTRIAPPRIGVVLNVGTAHLGEFGSVAGIAETKAELVQALPAASAGGLAVLNADDPVVSAMAALTDARVLRVGLAADADLRATDVRLDDAGRARFTLLAPDGVTAEVRLGLFGAHQVGNALAVIAVALELGQPLSSVLAALGQAAPVSRWRMEVRELDAGLTLINDAYNANPESMGAALRALVQMGVGRRTVAVLGAMRELGPTSGALHHEIGVLAADLGVSQVIAVGDGALEIADGVAAGTRKGCATTVDRVADVDAAHDLLETLLQPGDVVLFKSSRDSGLRYLGDRVARERGAVIPA